MDDHESVSFLFIGNAGFLTKRIASLVVLVCAAAWGWGAACSREAPATHSASLPREREVAVAVPLPHGSGSPDARAFLSIGSAARNPLSAFAVGAVFVGQQPTGTLSKIEVGGAERLSTERVIEISGLKTGQPVDKAVLQAAVERMMATGLFERVNWRTLPGEAGVTVTLTVREAPEQQTEAERAAGPKIERMEVRGLAPARGEALRARLEGPMAGREFSQEMAEEVAGPLVRAALAEWGHWSPAIKFNLEAGTALAVEVTEGPVTMLGEVLMEGGDARWLAGAGYVKGAQAESKKLNLALGKVIQAARNAGYLAAAARSEPTVTGGRLDLKLTMEPGVLYRFGELRIDGLDAQREKRARGLWKLKPGDPAGTAALEEWIRLVFEQRIPVRDRVQREWRPRQGEAIADAVVSFR